MIYSSYTDDSEFGSVLEGLYYTECVNDPFRIQNIRQKAGRGDNPECTACFMTESAKLS